jgi:hypothetical protein
VTFHLTGIFLVAAVGLTGCASNDTAGTPNPSPSGSLRIQFFKLGARTETAKGTVAIHAYDPAVEPPPNIRARDGFRFVAIDVEGCAGPNADANTGIDPAFFYLQLKAEPYYPTSPGVREPILHNTVLAPGGCARGWVSFEVPESSKPQYAFFRSSKRIAWVLPQ